VGRIQAAGFNADAYQRDLRQLAKRLSKDYEVKTFSFSDTVKTGLDFSAQGKLTNASRLLDQVQDQFMNRNLGALILASDGIFNRGGNPLYAARELNVPIYTIALGDTLPRKDLRLADVQYNDLVYLDNTFNLHLTIEALGGQGENSQLSIEENGKKVKLQNLRITQPHFIQQISVPIRAHKTGIQQYRIALSPLDREISTENNVQTIFVEVIDGRKKILILSGAPHPDISALRRTIAENAHYEVQVALADAQSGLKIEDYDLAIFYQFPTQDALSKRVSSAIQAAKIPIWYILGAQTDLPAFNAQQPFVKIGGGNGRVQEVFPLPAANFTLFALEATAKRSWTAFSPLLIPFGNMAIKGSYSSFLDQKIGRVNTTSPLFFFMNTADQKMAFLLGEGLWKWQMEEAKNPDLPALSGELIRKTVQYLSVSNDKRQFKVSSSQPGFDENDPVILHATLYNDSYMPVNEPEVGLQIQSDKGNTYSYTFSKEGAAYRLSAGPLPAGQYRFKASTKLGDKTYTADGAFYVKRLLAEFQQSTANHNLLHTMAAQSGGIGVMPHQIEKIEQALRQNESVKTIRYEDRRYEPFIDLKIIFALIIVLLSAEWFLRKQKGEI